jgi:hypothetical protein
MDGLNIFLIGKEEWVPLFPYTHLLGIDMKWFWRLDFSVCVCVCVRVRARVCDLSAMFCVCLVEKIM